MGDSSVTSNVINVIGGIKSFNGEKPKDFSDWHKKTGFMLSMQRPDIVAVLEGQTRPAEESDDAGTDGADTGGVFCAAPQFTPGLLDTPGRTVQQRQAAFDRANPDLYAIPYLVTDKAAALLVAIHAYNERGTCVDGQKSIKELEDKLPRVTNETIRALQAALAATTMDPDDYPDNCIMRAKRLRSRLTAVKEPITERHFKDIIVQGHPDKYRDIKLATYRDPDFDLPKVQATMRHLYLDDLSRNKDKGGGIAGRGVVMSAESAPDPNSIIRPNCGKGGHYRSGCAVPGKTNDRRNNGRPGKSKKPVGKAADATNKWCSVHKTTSHNDADCYKQGASGPIEGGVLSAVVLGADSLPAENDEKLAINFDDDFDGGFQC